LEKCFAFDVEGKAATIFAKNMSEELGFEVVATADLKNAVGQSDICVTCTTSKKPFLKSEDISPGTFIAAVGADSEDKQELEPELLVRGKLVVDVTEQCATIGELHHAIRSNLLTRAAVHAELGEVVARRKPGRQTEEEIIIFDSTGMALQDVAAAAIVYEKALEQKIGWSINFGN
jgi:alanine dehydrogenase